jgi:hypothetical protein
LKGLNRSNAGSFFFASETEKNSEKVFQALERRDKPPEQGIFYNGQVYDAWRFASKLVRQAKTSFLLVDNYVSALLPGQSTVIASLPYPARYRTRTLNMILLPVVGTALVAVLFRKSAIASTA